MVDPEADCRSVAAMDATAIAPMAYETYRGRVFYRSDRWPELNAAPGRDLMAEYADGAKRHGLKLWTWVVERGAPVDSPLARTYSDCTVVDSSGRPVHPWSDPNVVAFCPNSRWTDFVCEMFQEILEKFPQIEVFVVADQPGHFNGACYCSFCKRRFEHEAGHALPVTPDWENEDSIWWRFQRARTHWWTEFLERVSAACKEVKAEVITGVNINPGAFYARSHIEYGLDMWTMMEAPSLDVLVVDAWRGSQHPLWWKWCTDLARKLAGRSGKRVYTIVGGQTSSAEDTPSALWPAILGRPEALCMSPLHAMMDNPRVMEAAGETFRRLSVIGDTWTHAEPELYAAVIVDRAGWDHAGLGAWHGRSQLHAAYGAYLALTWSSLPVDLVLDEELSSEVLARYRVVFVPEAGFLSKGHLSVLEDYAISGGGLVVEGPPGSEIDQEASVRFMKDVCGAVLLPEVRAVSLSIPESSPLADDKSWRNSMRILVWPPRPQAHQPLEALGSGEVLAEMSDLEGVRHTAILLTTVGEGRVITCSPPLLDAAMAFNDRGKGTKHHSMWVHESFNYFRLFARAARLAAGAPPEIDVETSDDSLAATWRTESGWECVVLNLNHHRVANVRMKLPSAASASFEQSAGGAPVDASEERGIWKLVLQPDQVAMCSINQTRA